jgi:DNA-binding CsgD family transcriptional regulator
VKLAALGNPSRVIAQKLGNKPSTIKTHRRNIKKKLGLNGHRSLERWCGDHMEEILRYETDMP